MQELQYKPELSPFLIVYSEIMNVTTALRKSRTYNPQPPAVFEVIPAKDGILKDFLGLLKNRPDGGLGAGGEGMLMAGFSGLRRRIEGCNNLRDLDPTHLLTPFLDVIKSGDTSGAITGSALNAVESFLNYRILDPHHPDLALAVHSLTHALTRCKFEATDVTTDELVLHTILRLLRTLARSEVGKKWISDKGVCEMVEVAFGMHFQSRISELLRKGAEETLLVLTQALFERLVGITRESEHQSAVRGRREEEREETPNASPKRRPFPRPTQTKSKPFGIPAILEFTRVLITLVDPKDLRHTDTLHRTLALRLATRALEIGGKSLAKWVHAGVVLEQELERASKNYEDKFEGEEGMTIMTELPATVVSVGANGANYAMGNSASVDLEEERIKEQTLVNENVPDAVIKTVSLSQAAAVVVESTGKEELQEVDFQKLAINIKHMIVDDLTRHLFQLLLVQNTTNLSPPSWFTLNTVSLVLRTISALFSTMAEHLIPQQQWFIHHLMRGCESGVFVWDIDEWAGYKTGLSQGSKTEESQNNRVQSPVLVSEIRELYMETLLQICRSETCFSELYIFHDTNISDKTHFSFPDASPGGFLTNSTHHSLSFDGILLFLRCLAERRANPVTIPQVIPQIDLIEPQSMLYSPEQLIINTKRKAIFLKGANLFNESAKKGIKFFQEHDFLPIPLTPAAMAQFISSSANLSKAVIGDYLGRPDQANQDTLHAFVELFNFEGRRIDEALRVFMETFRIPGESQMIERILDAFSKKYFETVAGDPDRNIKTELDTGVLAFSIIMLNTDQFNPTVKRRMTFEDYRRNVRGLNSGQDFSLEYLHSIFNAIQQKEIVLAEERGGDLGFNYEWKELTRRMEFIPHLSARDTNAFDKDMFVAVSTPILAANVQDTVVLAKALEAIQNAALLAVHYQLHDIFDFLLASLFRNSGLSKASRTLPIEIDFSKELQNDKSPSYVGGDKKAGRPDLWAIDFGQSHKSQVAAVLAFSLLKDFPDASRNGWKYATVCVENLFLHQLLPSPLMLAEDFCKGKVAVPRLLMQKKAESDVTSLSPKKEQGLFSSFAQFLSLSSDYDVDQDDMRTLEGHRTAREGIEYCCIEELLDETRFMEEPTVLRLLEALIDASFSGKNGEQTVFAQSAVFFLEVLFKIVLRNRDRLRSLWPILSKHLEIIIQPESPLVLLERACTNVLRLLLRLTHVDELQSDVFKPLELLLNLKTETVHSFAEQLTAGFLAVTKTDISILSKQPSRWETLFRVLSISATHPIASSYSFELTSLLLSGHPDSPVNAEHFGECVDLLLSFSSGVFGSINHIRATGTSSKGTTASSSSDSVSSPLLPKAAREQAAKPNMVVALNRALKAIEKLYNLHLIIPRLIDSSGAQSQRGTDSINAAWFEFWLPVVSGLGQQCSHPSVDIRHQALSHLQRILLSEEFTIAVDQNHESEHRVECFDIVLFPMLDELSSLDISLDAIGGAETLVRACVLVTKVFLKFATAPLQNKEYVRLWTRILEYFGVLVTSSSAKRNEYALEGIQESLKNAILVLMADQVIVQPSLEVPVDLSSMWSITWGRVDKFCPSIKTDLTTPFKNDTIRLETEQKDEVVA